MQLSGFPSRLEDQKDKQADHLIKPLLQAQTKQNEIYVQKQQNHYAKKPSHETIFTAFSPFPLLSQRQPQYYQPAATERQQEGSLVMVRDGVLHPPRNARRKGIKIVLWSRVVTAASHDLDSPEISSLEALQQKESSKLFIRAMLVKLNSF